jgi:hypothetical protein
MAVFKSKQKFCIHHRITSRRIWFQQDNAPPHVAASTRTWFRQNNVRLLEDWPPQNRGYFERGGTKKPLGPSPDINLVEHVWPIVTRSLADQVFNTRDELFAALDLAFAAIPPDFVKQLYGSLTRRLTAVMVQNGGHTRY